MDKKSADSLDQLANSAVFQSELEVLKKLIPQSSKTGIDPSEKLLSSVIQKSTKNLFRITISILCLFQIQSVFSENRVVNLTVEYKTVHFAGRTGQAIVVNNQLPAPTLHFKEGDHVTINVYNHLNKGTAIHWHGILVPWQMDGVEGVTQKSISPGGVFHYQFALHQSGTYWYHAHAGLQEQEGVYGAFIIDPRKQSNYKYTKDDVIILSDWSHTPAEKILTNLKKDGDYYSPDFPLQPSLMKFIHDYRKDNTVERNTLINNYKMMQQMRMGIYDLSDVAYDNYLLNGKTKNTPWISKVKVGDVVRLRFIGAMASTIYRVKIPNSEMEMVQVDGNDVKPYSVHEFSIEPGETYDVLVKITQNKPYVIYAESLDTRGIAVGALVTHLNQSINYKQIKPFPEPKPVTEDMMTNMMMSSMDHHPMKMNSEKSHDTNKPASSNSMGNAMKMGSDMKMDANAPMNHESAHNMRSMSREAVRNTSDSHAMNMPTEPQIVGDAISAPDTFTAKTSGTKYQNIIAAVKTNNPNKPVTGIIRMELFGYMNHFIWFINGLPEYKAHPFIIQPGKRYRLIFTNNSMMNHPMHIHGHWFILRNGHGAYDPLLHTIEVAPGATVVADVDTDASGQWFFHCHHLYHMMTGMSRVFQYSTIISVANGTAKPQTEILNTKYINRPIIRVDEQIPIDSSLVHHPMAHPINYYYSNYIDLGEDPFDNAQRASFKGLYGSDYNKLELFTNDAEINKGKIENADLDIFYWHLISQFWVIKGGTNYVYRPAKTPYLQPGIGIEGLMPYFIDTDIRMYFHDNSFKFDVDLSRDTQITNNFFIQLEIRSILATQTVTQDQVGNGLNQMRYIIKPYYRINPGLNIFSEFEHQQDYGALKNIVNSVGQSTSENTITFGFTLLF